MFDKSQTPIGHSCLRAGPSCARLVPLPAPRRRRRTRRIPRARSRQPPTSLSAHVCSAHAAWSAGWLQSDSQLEPDSTAAAVAGNRLPCHTAIVHCLLHSLTARQLANQMERHATGQLWMGCRRHGARQRPPGARSPFLPSRRRPAISHPEIQRSCLKRAASATRLPSAVEKPRGQVARRSALASPPKSAQ